MTRAARSIHVFSFWIFMCGVSLMFFPRILLDLAGIHVQPDVLARLFGMVLLFNAFYYFMAGRHEEMRAFYGWTAYTRTLALVIVLVLVMLNVAEPIVLPFVGVDAAGAAWTAWALRKDKLAEQESKCRPAQT